MLENIITLIAAIGGFATIQWIFNRKFEKRSLHLINVKMENELKSQATETNNAQFELFEKMNNYLVSQFEKFESQDKKHSEEHKKVNLTIEKVLKTQNDVLCDLKYVKQEQLRLQIMQLIDHSPEMRETIEKLYKEYKTNGGNSYLDIKYSDYIAKNKIEESIKKTNKKQAKK